ARNSTQFVCPRSTSLLGESSIVLMSHLRAVSSRPPLTSQRPFGVKRTSPTLSPLACPPNSRPKISVSPWLGPVAGRQVSEWTIHAATRGWLIHAGLALPCPWPFLGFGAGTDRGIRTSTSAPRPQPKRSRRTTSTARHRTSTHGFH